MLVAARLLCALAAVGYGFLTLLWCGFSSYGPAEDPVDQVVDSAGILAQATLLGVLTGACALYALRGRLRPLWLAVLAGVLPVLVTIWSKFVEIV